MSGSILAAPTPPAWVEAAAASWQDVLLDHAYCEKKAASSAIALMFAYPECEAQSLALARLAREELRHFEQVARMMESLGVAFRRLAPGRYAAGLRAACRTHEPLRRLDLMICGALIEVRSCERFVALAPRLAPRLGGFYADLARAEARHGTLYLEFAAQAAAAAGEDLHARLAELAGAEAALACGTDTQLRFHSGPPAA